MKTSNLLLVSMCKCSNLLLKAIIVLLEVIIVLLEATIVLLEVSDLLVKNSVRIFCCSTACLMWRCGLGIRDLVFTMTYCWRLLWFSDGQLV